MKIELKSVKEVGSCSFCRSGKVDAEKLYEAMQFPYDQVYEIEGNVIGVRMCENCVKEFVQKMLDLPVLKNRILV